MDLNVPRLNMKIGSRLRFRVYGKTESTVSGQTCANGCDECRNLPRNGYRTNSNCRLDWAANMRVANAIRTVLMIQSISWATSSCVDRFIWLVASEETDHAD